MKVLIVSFFYGGENYVGGSRTIRFAKGLLAQGHQLLVVTGKRDAARRDDGNVDGVEVIASGCIDLEGPLEVFRVLASKSQKPGSTSAPSLDDRVKRFGVQSYRDLVCIPDRFVLWAPWALFRSLRAVRRWQPDVILSSSPPFSSHVLGVWLGRLLKVPVVVDFRDLFVENPYSNPSRSRRGLDRALQKRTLGRVSGCITNSSAMAEKLKGQLSIDVTPVLTGYRKLDPLSEVRANPDPLLLVHTGTLYGLRRSPASVFSAMLRLSKEGIDSRFILAGDDSERLAPVVDKLGLNDLVSLLGRVSSDRSIQLQREADLLVVLLWSDLSEELTMTGKVMEYIERRKPILVVGPNHAAVSKLITDYSLGMVASNEDQIMQILRELWLGKRHGRPFLTESFLDLHALSVESQAVILEKVLMDSKVTYEQVGQSTEATLS